ncbi:MAG: FtsX-like permease family protein [Candidatus Bathyarchaeota archaeon]|uniref:ABC transporter permease n=1 Tax=Candidatus Bathycorpusculum sp. TaxID=2994959 RepID=UPI00282F14A7|nr:FtsX-like permease family protein [Candidatus Termiticorpusculum sp.]MCL2257559.1 FtsX-like permease family protein [Candidatus Termiticorpusculum sp.]MCL2292306.1 FtsX-like permease family protein [Candidatus Termiticorpusculum sp.]
MGLVNRAVKNISRRKIRAALVIIALSISLSIMISIPAGLMANQETTNALTNNLSSTITDTSESISQALSQIDVTLSSRFAGFGFRQESSSSAGSPSGQMPPTGQGSDRYGGFGGGDIAGQFGGMSQAGTPMNASLYADINSIKNVATVAAVLEVSEGSKNQTLSMMGQSFSMQITDYIIKGVPLTSELINSYNVLPSNIVKGRNLQSGETGVVLLSQNNSAFFNAGVGDIVSILNVDFTVVGIYEPTSFSDNLVLYMSLLDAQTITDNTDYITSLRVFTTSSNTVDLVVEDIRTLHPEVTVTTGQERLNQLEFMQSRYDETLESAQASLASTQATAIQEIIVVVAATSLIVLFVMLYTVRERTKEIGTLKAIGFSNRTVMAQFILEGLLLSLIAGIVGVVIASFAAPTLSSLLLPSVSSSFGLAAGGGAGGSAVAAVSTVSLNVELVVAALGGAMVLGILGTLYPAWRAAKIRPAEAMRYE